MMACFIIHLQSATQYEVFPNAVSFVGEDISGTFGILAHHAKMMTCLKFGLAWFRCDNNETQYLAIPGGMLYFIKNQCHICTRHYLINTNYKSIEDAIEQELLIEEQGLHSIKESLHHLDEELLKRLWELKRLD